MMKEACNIFKDIKNRRHKHKFYHNYEHVFVNDYIAVDDVIDEKFKELEYKIQRLQVNIDNIWL